MPYIGSDPSNRFVAPKAATQFSGDGSTTAFTLDHAVGSDEDILVSVDGVIQEPSVAYAVSNGTTLTFTAAPSSNSGNNIFVYYLFRTVGTVSHPSNNALQATSGTFTGDVTVDTDTLKVDTTNDSVGINTATPSGYYATDLVVGAGDNGGVTIANTNTTHAGGIFFADGTGTSAYRGQMIYDHNDDSFGIWTAATNAMMIDSTGAVTKPNQPAFLVQKSGAGQTNVSTGTTVTFDSEVFDRNGDFASNTFTAPVTGVYQLNFIVRVDQLDTDANWTRFQFITSNRTYEPNILDPGVFASDPAYWNWTIAVLADMDASDTAYVNFQQDGGSNQVDIGTVFFSGYLVA
jgi:hypothetical protein